MADTPLSGAAAFILESHRQRVKRTVEAIQRTVLTRGPALLQESVDSTRPLPVDRGTYRRGWKYVRLPDGAQIFSTTPYAAIIEQGRRPGQRRPPTAELMGWVRRKGLVKGRGKNADADARSMAYVVARAIGRRGTPPKRVFGRAMDRLRAEVAAAIRRALEGGE